MEKAPLGTDDSGVISEDMVAAMMKYMPLRALALFGGEDITMDIIAELVNDLNITDK